jgi:hypothetical protein
VSPRRLVLAAAIAALIALGCSVAAPSSPAASSGPEASAAGSGRAAIPAAIVGSWTTTITRNDLTAAGVTGGEIDENAGVFTTTFGADGTWSTSQVTDVLVRWPVFKGTFEATGPDSFRQTTTFPSDFAGDVVDFTWSIKDGALVLKVVNPPDPILPIVTETHPWQRKA